MATRWGHRALGARWWVAAAGSNSGAVRHTVGTVDGVRQVVVEEPPVLGAGRCPGAQRRIDRILGRDKVQFEEGGA